MAIALILLLIVFQILNNVIRFSVISQSYTVYEIMRDDCNK